MSRQRVLTLVAISMFALILSSPQHVALAAKPTKVKPTAGREIETVNTILSGKGSPRTSIGKNGDFYIDVSSFTIYGPKKNGKWPGGVSLKGPQGADGKAGERGTSGVAGASTKGDKGEKGDRGERGPAGDTGPQGATGATGATGPAGPAGAAGVQGAAGPAGAQGAAGATGLQGLQGEKGDRGDAGSTGATGSAGPKGDTGEPGPIGPSIVSVVTIDQFEVGVSPTTVYPSGSFGNLQVGKKYFFEILLEGVVNGTLGHGKFYGLNLESNPAGLSIENSSTVTEALVMRSGQERYVYYFRAIGTISNVTTSTALRVGISHLDGFAVMQVTGKACIREVSAIS